MQLTGKSIAVLISPKGTDQIEFTKPRSALKAAGATVTVISIDREDAKAVNGDLDPADSHPVDLAFTKAMRLSGWTGLEAHRPLGNVNRARRMAYRASADYRSRFNGCPIHEPSAVHLT